MRSPGTVRSATVLLGLVPAVMFGGESARLTIGGYMPPTQRAVAMQTLVTRGEEPGLVLVEHNNSGLGYTVTVESKPANSQKPSTPAFEVMGEGQPINRSTTRASFSRQPGQRSPRASIRIVPRISAPAPGDTILILTIISQ